MVFYFPLISILLIHTISDGEARPKDLCIHLTLVLQNMDSGSKSPSFCEIPSHANQVILGKLT